MKIRQSMRHLLCAIILLLCGSIVTSCLKNEEEVDFTQYNDLYVGSVALGTLPRYLHTTASDGTDSIYKTSVAASTTYPISIDHLTNSIYNADSLPVGVDAEKIIFSTFYVSQGTIAIQKLESEEDTIYTTTDSIDFSKGPRKFNLYGLDGTSRRTYTVDIRIHQEAMDSLTWRQLTLDDWNREERHCGHTGSEFEACGMNFMLSNGGMEVNMPDGTMMNDLVEETNVNELPTDNTAWILLPNKADASTRQVLLYGTVQAPDSLESRIWRRYIDTTGGYTYGWEYLPVTVENRYPALALKCPALLEYDKGMLLTGIDRYGKISVKYSIDGGRIWKNHNYLHLPDALKERTATTLKASIDADSNLWLLIDGEEVWYGRAHSVAWKQEDGTFNF